MRRSCNAESGQSLFEYVILLALISIPALFAIDSFRMSVSSYVERIAVSESLPLP